MLITVILLGLLLAATIIVPLFGHLAALDDDHAGPRDEEGR